MPTYEPVIGLEIHIQLNTQTKIFCACKADSWGAPPNTNICPVCCGLPGVLPVLNRAVVEKAALLAAALNCKLRAESFFDRKNYFYPDLPKGYQITQYDAALGHDGYFDVPLPDGTLKRVTIRKLHIEEDAGKTKNDAARGVRLIDMNRCGVPLVEMVTGPDLRSADEAAQFLLRLRQLLRWLDVSEANMERGHLRCDANVSIREAGAAHLNPKTEIKNINSIEALRHAIQAEVERQIGEMRAGRRVVAWTLDWDDETQTLRKMRSKETEADYRYFREPDLLSAQLTPEQQAEILRRLPELPLERRARFIRDYGLPEYDAGVLTDERALSDYFEQTVQSLAQQSAADGRPSIKNPPKLVANWLMNDILRLLNERGLTVGELARTLTPERLAELIQLVEDKTINRATGVSLLPRILEGGQSPRALVEAEGLAQISGDEAIRAFARAVIAENPEQVAAYRKKPTLLKWFVGQVMRKSQGKANAQAAERILSELLNEP
ncbi:MAG: Asp-tRNA(Asn)/Glu-tRNA(Gln) amidotransferase subunit GatB [Anaerolineales bacterium]|nr:Asp-tRNA(Asn)/Glu-tRNA(Gln) amidotransferase subunit GatB [Anaerolineales bacterium]